MDFELGSKGVVDNFHSIKENKTELGAIISNCQAIIHSHFGNSRIEFVMWQANETTHTLTKVSISIVNLDIFINILICIHNIIINEML